MGVMIHLTLPTPPSSNRWWRHVVIGKRVTTLLSREARAYKKRVASELVVHRLTPIPAPTPIAVSIAWFRGRKSGDLDKRLGIALDAMQGIVYENDSQVTRINAHRYEDPSDPRIEVTVEYDAA